VDAAVQVHVFGLDLGLIRCNQVNPRGDHEGLCRRSSNVQNF